jgi:hypothetical protein
MTKYDEEVKHIKKAKKDTQLYNDIAPSVGLLYEKVTGVTIPDNNEIILMAVSREKQLKQINDVESTTSLQVILNPHR